MPNKDCETALCTFCKEPMMKGSHVNCTIPVSEWQDGTTKPSRKTTKIVIDEIHKKNESDFADKYTDTVNHPKHYNFGTLEVIDVIEDWQLGFHLGNTVKYIARSKHKGSELEDLKKARWYLERKIHNLETKELDKSIIESVLGKICEVCDKPIQLGYTSHMNCFKVESRPITKEEFDELSKQVLVKPKRKKVKNPRGKGF